MRDTYIKMCGILAIPLLILHVAFRLCTGEWSALLGILNAISFASIAWGCVIVLRQESQWDRDEME